MSIMPFSTPFASPSVYFMTFRGGRKNIYEIKWKNLRRLWCILSVSQLSCSHFTTHKCLPKHYNEGRRRMKIVKYKMPSKLSDNIYICWKCERNAEWRRRSQIVRMMCVWWIVNLIMMNLFAPKSHDNMRCNANLSRVLVTIYEMKWKWNLRFDSFFCPSENSS